MNVRYGVESIRSLIAAILLAFFAGFVSGQDDTPPESPGLDVFCFSGSPPLLQVHIANPEQTLSSVVLESEISTMSYRIPPDGAGGELEIYLHPFLKPGLYEFEISLGTTDGAEDRTRYDIGFVDFVWGRDNLRFGNNSRYESVVGSFGEIFIEWLDERFGDVDPAAQVLLINRMYDFFGRNTGRCYAFSGTEVRYWRWPDLLPGYYDSTHDLRGTVARYQREMNFLQFDMAFDYFIAGPGMEQILNPMDRLEMEEQIHRIEERIAAGEPVAVGFAGPNLHHSMLVFGVLRNRTDHTVDLLVANNWKNDQKLNIHSRDAEIIRFHLSPEHPGPAVRWHYEDGIRKLDIDRLFVMDVQRGPYVHDRALLDRIIQDLEKQMFEEGKAVLVIEDVNSARVVNPATDESTGRLRGLTTGDLADTWYEKVGETYRFSFPADLTWELEIADKETAAILFAAPSEQSGEFVYSIRRTDPPEEDVVTVSRHPLLIANSGR